MGAIAARVCRAPVAGRRRGLSLDRRAPPGVSRALGRGILSALVMGAALCGAARSVPAHAVGPETTGASGGAISVASGERATLPPVPIPLDQIAPRATDMARLLRGAAARLAPGAGIERIERSLPAVSAELAQAMGNTLSLLGERPSLEILQAQEEHWAHRQRELGGWLDTLTARAALLQGDLDLLGQQRALWTVTQAAVHAPETPAALLGQVDAVLAAIAAALPRTRVARDHTLELQAQVAGQVGHCELVGARIGQVQQALVGGILARDGAPIWSPTAWGQVGDSVATRLSQIGRVLWDEARLYLSDPTKHLPIHLGVFLLSLVGLLAARARVERWAGQGEDVARLVPVFDRPIAAASLVALAVATGFDSPAPQMVKELFGALALAPMIRLARPLLRPAFRTALYTLGLLVALDAIRRAFGGIPPLVGQAIILAQAVAGTAVLAPLLWAARGADSGVGRGTLWRPATALALGALAVGFAASLLGYLGLARLTAPAALVAAADALWLFTVVEVGTAVTAFAFRVQPLRRLRMIKHHRDRLEGRIYHLFLLLGVLAWTWRYLSYLGLWEPILGLAEDLLALRLQMGSFGTSVAEVLAFVATLVVAFGLSSVLRFLLEEEVYPRAAIPSGTGYATSSVIHYAIVALAFFLALGFLGVSLTQVTVLAGALGVGLGFGLQGIVHNFVSGLILLFERPIHVGDAVQVGALRGWVRRIGIRASVVRTVQGAEIIVPNSQLTSEQVTNWTLSDQHRRIDLPVGLSYGAAPGRVISLLEGVARAHPRVLKSPVPQCLFMSYGDSAINFELQAWTEYAVWTQVQSDLTAAIYDAVYAAGLSFPFPQREVRLLADPAPADGGGGRDRTRPEPE